MSLSISMAGIGRDTRSSFAESHYISEQFPGMRLKIDMKSGGTNGEVTLIRNAQNCRTKEVDDDRAASSWTAMRGLPGVHQPGYVVGYAPDPGWNLIVSVSSSSAEDENPSRCWANTGR